MNNRIPEIDQNESYPITNPEEIEPIYIMTVELEEGKSQAIKIYANSTPNELAFEFCKENNLDINAMNYLSEQIKILLEELNNNLAGEVQQRGEENDCIQEVDEEEYQTDTRKTHKSNKSNRDGNNVAIGMGSLINTPHSNTNSKYTPHSNMEIYENNISEPENIIKSKSGNNLPPRNNSSTPVIRDENNMNDIDLAEMAEIEHVEENLINPRENNSNSQNNPNLNNNQNNLSKSKTSIQNSAQNSVQNTQPQEEMSRNNSQRLFSYQVFYENFKKNNEDKNVRIEKNGSITNSQTNLNNNNNQSSQKENIFEKLFRNSEVKRYGMNMKVRHDSNVNASSNVNSNVNANSQIINSLLNSNPYPKKELSKNNSSSALRSNILNNSQDLGSTIKTKNASGYYRNGEIINYGERLYQKGMKLKEETIKRLENMKKEQENSNKKIYTYKPAINEVTPDLMRKRSENYLNVNNEDYLVKYNTYLEEKFEKLRNKHQKSENDYSYAPSINKRSAKIADEKFQAKVLSRVSSSLSPDMRRLRIEDLYELSKVKEYKIKELGKQIYSAYNYKPQLNNVSPSNMNENPLLSLTFNQRLDVFRQKSQEKKKTLVENVHSGVDPKTGQNLFIPKLMSKSRYRMNNISGDVSRISRQHTSDLFNNLYSYAQKFSKNKVERQKEYDHEVRKAAESRHTTNDSELILMKKKDEIFRKIYKILDSDQDDQISSVNIDTKKLPSTVVNIFNPILNELKEENETLNENEFVRACEHLYEMLTYNEKRTILAFDKKNEENKRNNSLSSFTFKPVIDRNSKRIAESKQFTYSYIKTIPITTENKLNSLQSSSIMDGKYL